ncbi:hypothetical protein BC343_19610 [Mucilaginibacter pedocola]|uniref:Uncharacterized protein n=1 Tax=Mucilaginibacter pedocola TaxID=1792845 RepID=A0A1S9P6R1_9SPHI|nr:hypothetical protein BC343_19610 [Mucilaginibacter pedocola]
MEMAGLCGRTFLQFFEFLHSSFIKRIDIFIISSSTDPNDRSLTRIYPFVKGYFDKASGLDAAFNLPQFLL